MMLVWACMLATGFQAAELNRWISYLFAQRANCNILAIGQQIGRWHSMANIHDSHIFRGRGGSRVWDGDESFSATRPLNSEYLPQPMATWLWAEVAGGRVPPLLLSTWHSLTL